MARAVKGMSTSGVERGRLSSGDMYSLKTAKSIIAAAPIDWAVFLEGPIGIGKSTMVKELCEERDWVMVDLRLSQLEAIDLKGFPKYDEKTGEARWVPYTDVLPQPGKHGEKGILFLDEINLASPDVQKAAYQLILDRRIGAYKLPPGWKIVAAGNRKEDVGIDDFLTEMSNALKNRFFHVKVEPPVTDEQRNEMFRWFYSKGSHPSVISYLKQFPQAIYEPKTVDVSNAWPSPRTWKMLSDFIRVDNSIISNSDGDLTDDNAILQVVASGAVGPRGLEFATWVRIFDKIPDGRSILEKGLKETLDSEKKQLPTIKDADQLTALCTSIVSHLQALYNKKDVIRNFFDFLKKVPEEFAVYALQECWRISAGGEKALATALYQSPEYAKFAVAGVDLIDPVSMAGMGR